MSVTAVPIRPLARGSVLKLWIGLLVLALGAAAMAWVGTSGQQVITTPSGLRYRVIEEGTGPTITPADLALVHYTGRLEDGTVFDSSEERGGQPMVTGVSGLIPGFAEGLQLMRAGGRYRLWIPPELGYGNQIPPGAPFGPDDTLEFDMQIIEIAPGMAAMQQMMAPPPGAQPESGAPEGAGPPPSGPEEPAGNIQ